MPLPPLLARLLFLSLVLGLEIVVSTVWLDTATLDRANYLIRLLADSGSWSVRFSVIFLCFAACFLPPRLARHRQSLETFARTPFRWPLVGLHLFFLAILALLSRILFAGLLPAWNGDLLVLLWLAAGCASTTVLALAFLPLAAWRQIGRAGGSGWLHSALAATVALLLSAGATQLWRPAARLTFYLVAAPLRAIVPGFQADPAKLILHGPTFEVAISEACSGLEGIGLILVFGSAWLIAFRREYRFPQALALLPLGVVLIYTLNVVRIALLFLIGHLGAPEIAAGGFHSQAGWIAFTVAALVFAHLSRRIQAFSSTPVQTAQPAGPNPAAPYLIPFLAILAAAQISITFSAGFEYLYPLRLIAAVASLWYFRDHYRRLPWRIHWPLALGAGTLVLVLWLALERLIAAPATQPAPPPLAWAILRVLGATLTVPIAEELAFRGFLLRRITSADFESVSLQAFHWWPFLLSSVAFGLLHGPRAIAGILAGMIYALVLRRHGSLGDAAAAHGITNALLAVWVLATGQYQLW
ncbi:MAG: exosortase E/protease, VPEID-CTERM system [Bryobacterales bacterium]|nr:exosortase E/protease, VPEID-CTERM system [Bryobacterales bacterium]